MYFILIFIIKITVQFCMVSQLFHSVLIKIVRKLTKLTLFLYGE